MAKKQMDGVIEAVHYCPDGQVDWVRAYMRLGSAWSDRVILSRDGLIREIKAGMRFMLGKRVEFMAGTFDVTVPVKVAGRDGQEVLLAGAESAERDRLEGAPVL
jgi:hypothetical protein